MQDELVSIKTALLAKDKKFDALTLDFWWERSSVHFEYSDIRDGYGLDNHNKHPCRISQPTQSLLARWLREEHKVYIHILLLTDVSFILEESWIYRIYNITEQKMIKFGPDPYKTYEKALEAGLLKALKLI